MQLYLP
jgi:hypothetical protein